ncbi:MAG: cytochrome d ubiquinol oxidase subunit II [Muribaculaceae bacterium]|jgi:cytochrome d ubiquinol oxidase subunit II|nr:cytochrome d ubiquinol oxidase subunit II [Muribaculaceae bacterium]MBO7165155.1 cytochrome d ubiquinol oxidase subunit II [Muribaculaceae bacterium]MBQ2399973.1 cytochrome d ubiquinol oxidase subunit II [Muribaculaceae bacterium]MBQ5723694.1 cytochrome d ubiquinol oxidase subunit II [Muribaculaceae bacterium]MBR5787508.1 cytochrome d ubiquinol oxidase subunit II [Muribaculaceae bacterium]
MITYEFLQEYWWFLISLLGGLLVFLLFVQGANFLIFIAGKDEDQRQLIVNSTGRKWELTFTTLVTFGGAFFASFPLFYSTSFGGAYWVWILILITFVFQAVSYEFQTKQGNLLGRTSFRWFLAMNGCLAPILIGAAVGTFFTGSEFVVNKNAVGNIGAPVISQWQNDLRGLEAVGNPFNVEFGLMVFFLAVCLGALYLLNNVSHAALERKLRSTLKVFFLLFLVAFVAVVVQVLLMPGFAVDAEGVVSMVDGKYLTNFLEMPIVLGLFLVGAVLVVVGIVMTLFKKGYRCGIWWAGPGTVFAVMAIFMLVGYNGTAYYPSSADLQSSLTLANSCSSEFTLTAMAIVSLIIPFVVAYIAYFWRQMDKKSLTTEELNHSEKY